MSLTKFDFPFAESSLQILRHYYLLHFDSTMQSDSLHKQPPDVISAGFLTDTLAASQNGRQPQSACQTLVVTHAKIT